MPRIRSLIVLMLLVFMTPCQGLMADEPVQAAPGDPAAQPSMLQPVFDWLTAIVVELIDRVESCTECDGDPPPPSDMSQETCTEALPNVVPGGSPEPEPGC